jgi:hypothetical protein
MSGPRVDDNVGILRWEDGDSGQGECRCRDDRGEDDGDENGKLHSGNSVVEGEDEGE